jgi:hypothetical protein
VTKETLKDYDFSKGIRGKYAQCYAKGSNVVVISPDVAEVFPDSESVNEALRMLIKIAQKAKKTPVWQGKTKSMN